MVLVVKNTPLNTGDKMRGFDAWVGKIPWRSAWQPTPVFLPEESHGQRSLEGYSSWSRKELDTTEQLTLFTSPFFLLGLLPWLSGKIYACNAGGTGNSGSVPGWGRSPGGAHGNPFQYPCLENPMDGGAWQATVHGVAKVRHN